jgi:hypothetical protein
VMIVLAGAGFGWLPTPAWLACVGIFSVTPAGVWLAERRRERRLTRRLQSIPGASTQPFAPTASATVPDERKEAVHGG